MIVVWMCVRQEVLAQVVYWVGWVFSGCVDLCSCHTHVLFEWDDVCFMLEVRAWCCASAPSGNP